jgi:micrococcal nuclease
MSGRLKQLTFWAVAPMLMVLLVSACVPFTSPSSHGPGVPDGSIVTEVTRIVDGDTLYLAVYGERVRLIGIDTPEISGNEECYGSEATDFLDSLVPPGTEVEVVFDVEQFDQYGRYLAYLYRSVDGLFVNEKMIADGYARRVTFPPNVAHVDEFRDAEADARADNLGLWGGCPANR